MPWKNGQGTTVELLKEPIGSSEDFLWRLSKADVTTDGAFSNFSGYDRTLVLLTGNGISLEHNNSQSAVLTESLQFAGFSGADNTVATLHNGAITDFNVMTRTGLCSAVVQTTTTEQHLDTIADEIFIYAVETTLTIHFAPQNVVTLPAQHLLRTTDHHKIVCRGGPSIAITVVHSTRSN